MWDQYHASQAMAQTQTHREKERTSGWNLTLGALVERRR
jgi:hypothetical protein